KRNETLTLAKSDLVYNDDNEIVQLQKRLIHMVKGTKPLHDTRFAYRNLSEVNMMVNMTVNITVPPRC
ncbi:hypothetical protein RclHR1_33570001, partial [Rhizophagus clarus]